MTDPGPYSIGSDIWPGLAKLAEECGEVVQVIGKIIALGGIEVEHWDGTNLSERLADELGDLLAAIDYVQMHNPLDWAVMAQRHQEKYDRFERWDTEQRAPQRH